MADLPARYVLAAGLFGSLVICGCDRPPVQAIPASSTPPIAVIEENDAEMDAAEAEARSTFPKFLEILQQPAPGQSGFAVKVGIEEGDEIEVLWLIEPRIDQGQLVGTVDADPQIVKRVKRGDVIPVRTDDVCDWLYVENGEIQGGYTMKLMMERRRAEP